VNEQTKIDTAEHEAGRLAALRSYGVLDTPPEPAFDDIARLAADACEAPIALVSLVDEHRQWFKAHVGLARRETPRHLSFCAHAIEADATMTVRDAAADARFATNALVIGEPGIRFYAGAPLVTPAGHRLGTLCVIDTEPRPRGLTDRQARSLGALAAQVVSQLELRREVRERTATEARLRESEARFRHMADNAPVIVWMTDADNRTTYLNQNWYEFSGQSPAEALGHGWIAVLHPDEMKTMGRLFAASAEVRVPFDVEIRLRRRDGAWRWMINTARPRYSDEGAFLGYIGSLIDITERKTTEAELGKAQDDLMRVSRLSAMGAMATTLAHELNQPLTASSNYMAVVRMLLERSGPLDAAAIREAAEAASRETLRAGEIIRRIRSFTVEGRVKLKADDLAAAVGTACEEVRRLPLAAGVEIVRELHADRLPVMIDRLQIEQVLVNLLRNAIEAMEGREVRRLRLTSREVGDRVELSIADSGPGLSEAAQAHLFEPFRTTKHRGMGLGLPMCRTIVEAHGGSIAGRNAEVGAVFTLVLPIHQATADRTWGTVASAVPA